MRQANSRLDVPSSGNVDRELIVCQLRATGPIAITAGGFTPIQFDVEESDLDAMHNPAVNPDRITLNTIPADATGVFITGWCEWDAGTGFRELSALENGGGTGELVNQWARSFEIEQCVWAFRTNLAVGTYYGLAVITSVNTNLLAARFEIKFIFS